MPFYVLLLSPPGSGVAEAMVEGPMTAQQFEAKFGITPANSGVPGETDQGWTTEAEAQAVADKYNKQPPSKRESGTNPPDAPSDFPKLSNPLDGIQEIGHWLGVVVTAITDVSMWRSLGWLLLGGILLISGLFLWLKDKGVIPETIPVPV